MPLWRVSNSASLVVSFFSQVSEFESACCKVLCYDLMFNSKMTNTIRHGHFLPCLVISC